MHISFDISLGLVKNWIPSIQLCRWTVIIRHKETLKLQLHQCGFEIRAAAAFFCSMNFKNVIILTGGADQGECAKCLAPPVWFCNSYLRLSTNYKFTQVETWVFSFYLSTCINCSHCLLLPCVIYSKQKESSKRHLGGTKWR